jgi:hypothetical protein
MPKGKPEKQFAGNWFLVAPTGTVYEGQLQWKNFYAQPKGKEYALFKVKGPQKRKPSPKRLEKIRSLIEP